jgi:hypothetical protein
MILRVSQKDISPNTLQAVLAIHGTLKAFPPDQQLAVAAECVAGVLRELRLLGQREPGRRESYDTLCSDVQAWLRWEIETLRFEKSH